MTEQTTADHLDVLESLADRRHSNLRVDPDRPIDTELVERLLRVAATAPNHKKTFPWRFRVVTGDARTALGEALAQDLEADGEENPAKVAKARVKYRRAPVVVVVAAAAGDHPVMTAENRDAVAAGHPDPAARRHRRRTGLAVVDRRRRPLEAGGRALRPRTDRHDRRPRLPRLADRLTRVPTAPRPDVAWVGGELD